MIAERSVKSLIVRATNPWFVLLLFWLIYFLNQADLQMLFTVLPLIKRELEAARL